MTKHDLQSDAGVGKKLGETLLGQLGHFEYELYIRQ